MSETRIQRFGRGERFDFLAPDQDPPEAGWAVRAGDHAVFRDGKKIGTATDFQIGSPGDRAFKQIEYHPD